MWRRLQQGESRLEEPSQLQRGQTHQERANKARWGSGRENGEEKLRGHQRASTGFSQLPSALTSQGYGIPPRPSMWPKVGRTYTSGILFQLLAVQKARSPVQGENGSSALVALSPPIFLLRVKGISELERGLAKDAEGWGPSSKSKGICTPTGTALFSQLPSITPVAFIPASCSCLCYRHSAAPRSLSYLDRLCHEAQWDLD